ncbi:MAG: SHOCT domain-containing protein [Dehalococcoidia bacterium]
MMWDSYDGMGWWMVFGMIWMVIFWGAIVALIVWGVSRVTGGGGRSDEGTPLDIARRRYANGEITREQFEQLRSDLS